MVFEAMVIDGITWQVNTPGEDKHPEALGLSPGAPPTVGNWRGSTKEIQKMLRKRTKRE